MKKFFILLLFVAPFMAISLMAQAANRSCYRDDQCRQEEKCVGRIFTKPGVCRTQKSPK